MRKLSVIAALAASVSVWLSACSVNIAEGVSVRYENADMYSSGDRVISESVTAIDVDWPSGSVTVTAADVSDVSVHDATDADLSSDLRAFTWLDGPTLRVRFCRSGKRYDEKAEKKLEITVPSGTSLNDLSIRVSSANVLCEGLTASSADVEASSGSLVYNGTADVFSADSSSGDITFTGETVRLAADSSSGNVSVTQKGQAESISIDTSSGDITVDAENVAALSTDSSSGDKQITLGTMPAGSDLEASSGSIDLYLPENASFTADVTTSSGSFSCEFAYDAEGSERYVCGSGESSLKLETSSGNIRIHKALKE